MRPWSPTYDVGGGDRVTIGSFHSDICPREVVRRNPQATELVQIYARAQTLHDKGVSLFAPGEMPAKMVDAFTVFANEDAAIRSEMTALYEEKERAARRRK